MAAAVKARAPKLAVTGAQVRPPAGKGNPKRPTAPRSKGSRPAPQRADFKGRGTPPPVPPPGPGSVATPGAKTWGERISGLLADPKVWWGLGVAGGGYVAWKLYQSVSGASSAGSGASTSAGSGSGGGGSSGSTPPTSATSPGSGATGAVGGGGGGSVLGNPGAVGGGGGGSPSAISPGLVQVLGAGAAGPLSVNTMGAPGRGAQHGTVSRNATRRVSIPQPSRYSGGFAAAKTPTRAAAAKTEARVLKIAPGFYNPMGTKKPAAARKAQAKTEARVLKIAPGFYNPTGAKKAAPHKAAPPKAAKRPPAHKTAIRHPAQYHAPQLRRP